MRNARYLPLIAALAACAPHADGDPTARAALARATATITAADLHDRVAFLASDELRGRNTPSPGLDRAAEWIGSQFAALGLRPAGTGGWLQRYPYPLQALDTGDVRFQITEGATHSLQYGVEFYATGGGAGDIRADAVFLDNADAVARAPEGSLRGRATVVRLAGVPEAGRRGLGFARNARAEIRAATQAARAAGAAALVLVLDPGVKSEAVAALADAAARPARVYGDDDGEALPAFFLSRPAALRVFRMAGLDGEALLAAPGPDRPVPLPGLTLTLSAPLRTLDDATAPNVVALLPGSDSVLRNTYVLVSAHMDHMGVGRPVDGDSIYNGADDDASGTAAVIEVARAFAALPSPPKRSVLFLAVSGEEKGLLGSRFFADHPTVPIDSIVADLNMDMISRNAPDSIVVIGQQYSSLGPLTHTIAGENPDLHLTISEDLWPEQRFFFRSDHFSFAAKDVPALFFFAGTHPQYHRPGDEVDTIDADKNARVARLVFLLADRIANADERPRWTPDGLAEVHRLTASR